MNGQINKELILFGFIIGNLIGLGLIINLTAKIIKKNYFPKKIALDIKETTSMKKTLRKEKNGKIFRCFLYQSITNIKLCSIFIFHNHITT